MKPKTVVVSAIAPAYADSATACFFVLGALVTAIFSGSLAVLTRDIGLREVLGVGLVVPSFTWVVQLGASGIMLKSKARSCYWGDLARVCLFGSIALLPAAAVNLTMTHPPAWPSMINVLASVSLMARELFRRSAAHGVSLSWPVSWCVTIGFNILIFCWASRNWWSLFPAIHANS